MRLKNETIIRTLNIKPFFDTYLILTHLLLFSYRIEFNDNSFSPPNKVKNKKTKRESSLISSNHRNNMMDWILTIVVYD